MGQINLGLPIPGQPDSSEEAKIPSDFTILQTLVNGNIDTNNLSPTANILGTQLSSTANIQGSQIAANAGIMGSQLAANAGITVGQLAGGAVLGRFSLVEQTANYTAANGELVVVTGGSNVIITLPSPTLNAIAGVVNLTAGVVAVVATGGPYVFGSGIGAVSFGLNTSGALALLQADGTNWIIFGGQQDSGWQTPSFTNGWIDSSLGPPVGYRKVGTRVYLRGSFGVNTLGRAAFTLPGGYRPVGSYSNFSAWTPSTAQVGVQITNGGIVTPFSGSGGSSSSFGLDGISFDTI